MTTNSTRELLIEGLEELYYAEKHIASTLETLTEQTADEEASEAFRIHRDETEDQIERLDRVFNLLGEELRTREDPVVTALIGEHDAFAEENAGEVLDRYNIAVGQQVEHYEIAAYGNLTSLAAKHGYTEVADTLEQSLREEQSALERFSQAAESFDRREIAAE